MSHNDLILAQARRLLRRDDPGAWAEAFAIYIEHNHRYHAEGGHPLAGLKGILRIKARTILQHHGKRRHSSRVGDAIAMLEAIGTPRDVDLLLPFVHVAGDDNPLRHTRAIASILMWHCRRLDEAHVSRVRETLTPLLCEPHALRGAPDLYASLAYVLAFHDVPEAVDAFALILEEPDVSELQGMLMRQIIHARHAGLIALIAQRLPGLPTPYGQLYGLYEDARFLLERYHDDQAHRAETIELWTTVLAELDAPDVDLAAVGDVIAQFDAASVADTIGCAYLERLVEADEPTLLALLPMWGAVADRRPQGDAFMMAMIVLRWLEITQETDTWIACRSTLDALPYSEPVLERELERLSEGALMSWPPGDLVALLEKVTLPANAHVIAKLMALAAPAQDSSPLRCAALDALCKVLPSAALDELALRELVVTLQRDHDLARDDDVITRYRRALARAKGRA